MNHSTRLTVLATGLFVMHSVLAETVPEDNIIVSASRTPVSRLDAGSTVSTLDRPDIENRQSVFATDLLQDLPGLAVSRSGNFGAQTAVRIRGSEANHVLVRIDGIEVNDPAEDDAFAFAHLTANDIERIEVVRGPQSALWGSDALAGIIDITTRRSTDRLSSDLFVEGGAFETLNGGMHLGTRGAKSGIDLTASYLDSDGSNISRIGSEHDGYRNLTTNLRADIDITDGLQLDASLRHIDTTKQYDAVDFSTGLPADTNHETDSSQTTFGAGGKLALFDNFLEQSLRLTGMMTDNENFSDDSRDTKTAAEKYGIYYQGTLNFSAGPAESSSQKLTLAIDHERENFKQRGTGSIYGDPNQDQDFDNTGLSAEYRAISFGGFSVSLGLRHDLYSEFDDVTTWRTTASRRFDESGSRLHASFGTGQKSPTFTERFGYFPDQFQGNPDLKPEKSKGYDLGFEQRLGGGRFLTDITYFNERLEDEINGFFFDPSLGTFGMFTAVNRDGTSKSKGVEVEMSVGITDGLDVTANYTYTDATQPDANGQQQREIRRPRHMAALNVNYVFMDRAQFNANISWSGEQTDLIYPPFPASSETVSLDAYTLVNLAGSFAITDNITIYARVENLFDTAYENVFGFATPGIGASLGTRIRFRH